MPTNSSIMKLTSFEENVNHITFSDIKSNKYNAGKTVFVNFHKQKLRLQLPKSQLGVFAYEDKTTDIKKYSALISIDTFSESQRQAFFDLDQKVIDYAVDNSEKFFDKKKSKELILDNYSSFLVPRKDKETKQVLEDELPSLKAKLMKNMQTGDFQMEVYQSVKKNGIYPKIENIHNDNIMEFIPIGSAAEIILECSGIWVVAGKFGLTWKVVQMKLYRKELALTGYAFDDEDETHQGEDETHQGEEEDQEDEEEDQEDELESGVNKLSVSVKEPEVTTTLPKSRRIKKM